MPPTTFVAQPAHLSMSAMRRILSPAATPTDSFARTETFQSNSMISSTSMSSSPQLSHRRRRGSLTQATSQQIIPIAVFSPLSMPSLSASAPSPMAFQSEIYDSSMSESDEECDVELTRGDSSDDLAMWMSNEATERSSPIAIPNAESGYRSQASLSSSPILPDPRPIVTSYLQRHASGQEGTSMSSTRTRSSRSTRYSPTQRSPFAPKDVFGEIVPGKPDMGNSASKRMAYFDEDALY